MAAVNGDIYWLNNLRLNPGTVRMDIWTDQWLHFSRTEPDSWAGFCKVSDIFMNAIEEITVNISKMLLYWREMDELARPLRLGLCFL